MSSFATADPSALLSLDGDGTGVSERPLARLISRPTSPLLAELTVTRPVVRLGSSAECDLRLNEAAVAAIHAELSLQEGVWSLSELGEHDQTRTWVDGQPVTGTVLLAPGSLIRLADTTLIFEPCDSWSASAPPQPAADAGPLEATVFVDDEPAASLSDSPVAMSGYWRLWYLVAVAAVIVGVALLIPWSR